VLCGTDNISHNIPTFRFNMGISHIILPIPCNIIMKMNNVMLITYHVLIPIYDDNNVIYKVWPLNVPKVVVGLCGVCM
jgi:hypothetical protein